MKPHSLICTDAEAKAFHEGRKTQFRRLVKPQPPSECVYAMNGNGTHALCFAQASFVNGRLTSDPVCVPPTAKSSDHRLRCPYTPGSVVLVKEAWNCSGLFFGKKPSEIICASVKAWRYRAGDKSGWQHGWRSAVHMPVAAVRTRRRVVAVRVERVSNISEEDARREGMLESPACFYRTERFAKPYPRASEAFAALWNSRHPGSWERGDWVWVVDVEKLNEKDQHQ